MRVGILLTCGKDLHVRIISLRREVWDHTTSLTPPLFIEVPVLSEICVLGLTSLPLSTTLVLDFGTVPTV